MKTLISGAAIVTCHGTERYLSRTNVLSLRQWMDAFGHEECLLALPYRHVNQAPRDLDLLDASWKTVELTNSADRFLTRRRQARACLNRLASEPFGAAYCRMPAYEAWWLWKFARRRRIPVVTELHGDWREAFLALPASNQGSKLANRLRARWADRAFGNMARTSVGVSCIGPRLRDLYVPEKVPAMITTNHTVAESEYRSPREFVNGERTTLVFIGELQKRKGLHVLFPALKEVMAAGVDFRLLIFGSGPEEAHLRQMARELGIGDRVAFQGYVPNGRDLFDSLHEADAFVLPSIGAEGVPRATHEAMAMGCPVIATDVGSTAWQLRDGGGVVVPPGDVQALAEQIIRILRDARLRQQLADNGLRNAREHTYEIQAAGIARFVSSLGLGPTGNKSP
jgi:glycosyltransferase involved in cell wall biosynthesis